MIFYLHGFRSSPQSFKARLLAQRIAQQGLAQEWCCPQLSVSPRAAVAQVRELIAQRQPQSTQALALIGSSLGGYYATHIAQSLPEARVVVINPAVTPALSLQAQVGIHAVYHSTQFIEVKPEHLQELEALRVPTITHTQRYFLLASTGDEVLDYREAQQFYRGAQQKIIQGSDHSISKFSDYVDEVIAFCSPEKFND